MALDLDQPGHGEDPLGLDAERDEDIRVTILGRQVRIQENDPRVLRQPGEVAAFAPHEHEIGAFREGGRQVAEQFERLVSVRVLVRVDEDVVLVARACAGRD